MSGRADRPRLLLVDDIEENLIALEALLKRLDVEIMTAPSGPAALELLFVHDFALALLDVNMPEMDGFQLAEAMRGTVRTKTIPIIFVTAAFEPQRVFRGYETGAVDYLIKPVEPRILLSKVQTFITLHEQNQKLARQVEELANVSEKLTESLRLHETFVAALNHDLRSPIHTITLGVTMLADTPLAPKQHDVIKRVGNAAHRMTGLLDDLYDLARMRLGDGIVLERTKQGDLGKLIREVVGEAELRTSERKIAFELRGDANGEWDLPRIGRVAMNLIGNAIAHGARHGRIEVVLDGTAAEDVSLAVSNEGVIPAELLPRMFEPFRRGERTGSGLGLGLYIVREITTAHGGKVSVTSSEVAGTRFEVRLPRHPSA